MFVVIATINLQSDKVDEGVGYLRELAAATNQEPGCRQYVLNQSHDDPARIVVYEIYDDEDAFKAHGASEHIRIIGGGKLSAVAAGPTLIETYTLL